MSALLAHRSAVCRQIMADLAEAGPWPMPITNFKDDEIYVYDTKSLEIKREIPCSDEEARSARLLGVKLLEGQTWARGLTAKRLGLWRAA